MKNSAPKAETVHPDLDIDEHLKAQEQGWKFQAIGMYCILVFIVSAALGLFGNGIVSKTQEVEGDTNLEYQRFLRYEAQTPIHIQTLANEDVTISLPSDYLADFEIMSILPEPDGSSFKDSRIEYIFKGSDKFDITFYTEPKRVGKIEGSLEINGSRFNLKHFIFP